MFNHRLTHGFPAWLIITVVFLLLHGPTFAVIITPSDIKRCPRPRSLCNRVEASKSEGLDDALEAYFADGLGTALDGDRELVWWALAGGEEGRWWWERDSNGQFKSYNRITKRATQLNETEEEKEERMARDKEEYEARHEEERRQREIERAREQRLNDKGTRWPDSQRGFCCEEGFTCMSLGVDTSLVYCFSEGAFLVVTPEGALLDLQTLEYIYPNDTTGNLRNYEVPSREEGVRYGPTKPTPIPIEVELVNAASWNAPHRVVSTVLLALGLRYMF
ncbi:hypothetical protein EV426DRAFT_611953 [Tirmania nivea]|nr:hypothetical protein EV426DRAFT_611953 [Tirmania nivea]